MPSVPFILNVDVEPDERDVERGENPSIPGFDWLGSFLVSMRHRLADTLQTPVRYVWHVRVDPQIAEAFGSLDWILRRYEQEFAEFLDAGDEVGVHPHFYRWDDEHECWFVDDGNQVWLDEVLAGAFDGYERFFGRPCEILRMGDGFTSQATMRKAEELGTKYELTPEPDTTPERLEWFPERHTGVFPDCRGMPSDPYHPSSADWRVSDPTRTGAMTILPISTGQLPPEWFPDPAIARVKRAVKRLLGMPVGERQFMHTANLFRPTAYNEYLLEEILTTRPRPFVNLVVRTNVPTPERVANIEAVFRFIGEHRRREDFVFSTPAQALDLLGPGQAVADRTV